MMSPEGVMVVRVSASTVTQPTTTETISTSPDNSVASLAALRGKRLRKYSETDASVERLSSSIRSENSSSQLVTKVPLTPLGVEDNVDYNFKRQASVRIKKMALYHDGSSLFPKLNDCAHFHYDHVELGSVQISMHEESEERAILMEQNGGAVDLLDCPFTLRMLSQGKVWLLKRCYEDFRVLDKQLHKCIYDRRFSQLVELPKGETLTGREAVKAMLAHYVTRFSQIAGDMINCGPVLNWLEIDNIGCHIELDNHGNHVVASEESAINIPAVAAAHVIKRYAAQAPDEISLEVGDMISVIDMPPPEDTSWWRGKNKFDVGFFPRQCVEIISEKLPQSVAERVPKGPKPEVMSLEASGTWSQSGGTSTQTTMLRKHGKLITFLRSFILERPTRRRLKQSGILKERVFGCDLGEHLLNTGTDVPSVVQDCTHFIEQYGICDGIYRLSGVASNVQYLRDQFDSETTPNLDEYKKDIHCVSSVCKLYFRELPNPLLTYQLYQKFEEAAMSGEENRLMKMHDTVQQLPPPHYRTLQFLIRHLSYMSSFSSETSMNIKNLAIVWAPNLLRSKDIETGSCAAFMEIKVQATVVEYLVKHCDLIFNDKLFPDVPGIGQDIMQRPKSLVLSTPTKLLSLEEARARSSSQGNDGGEKDEKPKFIEVGGGPAALPKQYHTVIDLPADSRKRFSTSKAKKSPGWKAFFSRSTGKEVKRKMSHDPAALRVPSSKHFGSRVHRSSLRSVKSAESLSSAESASEIQGQNKYSNIHDPVRFKGHMRRSSVACMENTLRRSSSDSFFEVDADIVAAATREMLAAQRGEDSYSRDEIFIEEESGATCQLGRRRGSGTNSPLWIDQSLSSMESDRASLRSPYAHQAPQLGRKMSTENNWNVHNDDIHMACDVNVHHYHEETPPPSPTEVTSPERYQCTIADPVAVPQRHPLKTSIAMPVAAAFTPEYRDVEMTESTCSATSPDHTGSVLNKISRAMSIKTKAKLKRESSTEADDYSRSPDTAVDDVMDRPIMVTVRTQTSPHDTIDDMDTGEEVRKYDVNLQTSGSDGAVFMRTPAQRRSMNLDLFSGLDEALLGTTAPRPKSIHVSSHLPLTRGSESYEDDFAAITTRLSLDNVLSEYDHILAKYNNRPLTPDFDRSDDMCKFEGMYPGQRIASPRHGITPVTALNSNCNNTRQRRLQHRYSMGDEMRAERFNNRYSSVIMDNVETRKRLSAGAVLDHHAPGQENDEEVVVVRLRRPRQPSSQKKLYASPERFSINSPEYQATFADHQNGNTPPESASDLRTLHIDEADCSASSVDAVYHVTIPTRPNSQRRGISKSFSLDFPSSIPDGHTRIEEGVVSEVTGGILNEAEATIANQDDIRLDNLEVDLVHEGDVSFAFEASLQDGTSQSPSINSYPIIISDELEL